MNFEGRWPFKPTGVSWGAVQNLSKARNKFLNVGDDYIKILKKKSKKAIREISPVDSRHDYMACLLAQVCGLPKDDLQEEQQEKVDIINSYFAEPKLRRLFYLNNESFLNPSPKLNFLLLHIDEPFSLRGLCAFFIKDISNEALPQNVINTAVFFFSLHAGPDRVFGALYQTLKRVYLPRLRRLWREGCEGGLSSLPAPYDSVLYSLEALGDAFKVSHLGVTRGLTLRRSSAALEEASAPDEHEANSEAEKLIYIWKDQIEQLLTSSSYLRKESETHGPRTEQEYWKCRRDSFGFLVHQFQQRDTKLILQRPLADDPGLRASWMSLDTRVRNSWREAKECAAFLEVLERYCQPLYSSNPDTISKSLPGLIRTLFTINTVSQYYNSTERMTAVLTKITNQMIHSCRGHISCEGSRTVWDQPEEVVRAKIQSCLALNDDYQSCFGKKRRDEEEEDASREFRFCEVFVFGKLDAFCNRLRKLLRLFDCVHMHESIIAYQQEVLDELPYSLEDSINKMRMKEYDFLDHRDLHFDEDFAEVMKVSEEIQKSVTSAFDAEFSSIRSTSLSLAFLSRLEGGVHNMQGTLLLEKYSHVLKEYRRELEDIKGLFKKHKQEPPLPKHYPPVAGRINWCRQLRRRIEEPLQVLKDQCHVLDSDLGKKVLAKYTLVHEQLVKYETDSHKHWYQEASQVGDCLLAPLLEQEASGELVVNSNEPLFVLVRESELMARMSLKVPPIANTALYQQGKLRQHRSCLEKLFRRHRELCSLPREELLPLLDIHQGALEDVLRPGLSTLTWSSLNTRHFIEEYRQAVTRVESLFDRLCKILNHRVDETLSQVAEVELCPPPPDQPVTVQAFAEALAASAEEGGDFLDKRSHAVEDAVQEVIDVFVKESNFTGETARQQRKKINDVSVGLQQQCSKKLLESVITSICDSLETLLYSTSYNEKAILPKASPWFKGEVHLEQKELLLIPSVEQVQEALNKAATDIVKASAHINQWNYKETERPADAKEIPLEKSMSKSDCSASGLTLYRQVSEDKEVLQIYGSIQTCMKNTKLELDYYLEIFSKYEHLWKKARNEEIREFVSTKRTLVDFEDKIKYYLQVRGDVEAEANEVTIGCIRLSLIPVKRLLVSETGEWCEAFGAACRSKYKTEMKKCGSEVKGFAHRLRQPAAATDEIKDLIAVLEEIREKEVDIDARITPVEECYAMLSLYGLVPVKEDLDSIESLRYSWNQTHKLATETQNALLNTKTRFQAQLTDNIKSFTHEFDTFQRDYQEAPSITEGDKNHQETFLQNYNHTKSINNLPIDIRSQAILYFCNCPFSFKVPYWVSADPF